MGTADTEGKWAQSNNGHRGTVGTLDNLAVVKTNVNEEEKMQSYNTYFYQLQDSSREYRTACVIIYLHIYTQL